MTSPSPSLRFTGTPITVFPEESSTAREEVLRLFPEPTVRLFAERVYSDISFPAATSIKGERPYVIINMVSSLDGRVASDGKASHIGSLTDRTVMRTLRSHADAVMVGAGTLRAEKLRLDVPVDLSYKRKARGLNPQPLAVVVTASGDIPLEENLLGLSSENLLVLASSETPHPRVEALSRTACVEVVPNEEGAENLRISPAGALKVLKKRHAVDLLLIEGGPALNHALVSSGLADELFLTLAPKLLGGEGTGVFLPILDGPTLPTGQTRPGLISIHLSGDELFLRYALSAAE